MGLTHFIIGFALGITLLVLSNAKEEQDSVTPFCNTTTTDNVQYQYKTDIVQCEHIVSFKGYFTQSTRIKYITAALTNAGVSDKL